MKRSIFLLAILLILTAYAHSGRSNPLLAILPFTGTARALLSCFTSPSGP